MTDLSFEDLVANPEVATTQGPPPIDITQWTVNYHEDYEFGKSGYVFVDPQIKHMDVYTVQGFELQAETLNLSRMAKLLDDNGPEALIKTEIQTLFKYNFDAARQVTCKYYGSTHKNSKTAIEPVGFPFEWPNETRVNICTKLSSPSAPVGCQCSTAQFTCTIGYAADVRSLYLYHDRDHKVAVNVSLERYGFGEPLMIIHTKTEDVEAWSYFGPVEKKIETIDKNPVNPEVLDSIIYFGLDYDNIFDKYLASLLDGLFQTYGELTKEISPTKEIQTEYFSYVKSV